MNKNVKRLWLEALRSGEYKQGRGLLRDGNKYCCLGVLCDIYRQRVGGSWFGIYTVFHDRRGDENASFLPRDVGRWAELPLRPNVEGVLLSSLNDGVAEPYCATRLNFDEIADLIQEHL